MKKLLLFSLILTSWVGWGQIQSNGTGGGDWANTATWNGGVVPSNSDAVTILAGDVVYTGTSLTRDNTTTVNGIFQINTGGWAGGTTNFTYGANGTLIFNNSGFYGVNSGTYWPSSNGPINVTVNSGSGINMGFTRTITGVFQTAAGVKGLALTFDGTCQINVDGYFTTTPTYGSSSTLIYNTGGSYGVYNEWTGGGNDTPGVGSGAPQNVIVKNNTVVTLPVSGKRGVAGNLTVEDTSSFKLGGDNFYIAGNWNFASGSTFTHNAKIVNFSGNSGLDQTITHGGSGEIFSKIILRNPNGSVKLLDNININGSGTADVITIFNSTKIIDLNGYEMRFTGGSNTSTTNGQIKVSANNCLITGIAGSTVTFYKYKNIINNSGTGSLIFDENVQVILNSGFDPGSALTTIKGTLQIQDNGFVENYPVIYTSNSTLKYYTTGAYNSGFEWKSNSISLTAGVPQNVEVHNGTILNLSSETHHALGNLSIYNNVLGTAVLNNSTEDLHVVGNLLNNRTINLNSTSGDLYVGGNWTNNGTFNPNNRAVFLDGTATQTIAGNSGGPQTFDYLILRNNFSSNDFKDQVLVEDDLTVDATYTLTIENSDLLSVKNKITNDGTIILSNKASLYQEGTTDNNTGSGTYEVKKFISNDYSNYDYYYWSSPIQDLVIGDAFPTTGTNPYPNYRYTYKPASYADEYSGSGYPQTTAGGDGYDDNGNDWNHLSDTDVMTEGIGFIAMGKDSPDTFSVANIGGTVTADFTVVFEGKVNNGDIVVSVSQDAYNTLPTVTSTNTYNTNLNFLGNPYPSAINIFNFYNDNLSVLDGNFYFWKHNVALAANSGPNAYDYNNSSFAAGTVTAGTTWTAITTPNIFGGAPTTEFVASCQGFMAGVKHGAAGTVTFKNAHRVTGNNNTFLKYANTPPPLVDRLWLNMTGDDDLFRQIAVGFSDTTTDALGQGDTPRMDTALSTDFYSLIQGVEGPYAIQFLSAFETSKTVPLGVGIQVNGSYSISLDHVDGYLISSQPIYLEDTYENVIHDFANGDYTFYSDAAAAVNDRFILRFTNTQLGHEEAVLEDLKLYPNPTKGLLNIAYTGSEPLQITLYNQVGHTVGTYEGVQVLDLSQLAQGMYFAKIANSQGSVTRKIVVE